MSVFIRKFEPGGVAKLEEGSKAINENTNYEVHSPKFTIGNYQINTNDFINDLENNFLIFQNVYGGTWTNREKEDIIRNHLLFIQNIQSGNITGIDSAGRFNVVDPGFAGIDFSTNGPWGQYSYYVKQIADSERVGNSENKKPKKTFTNTSILEDIHNNFFGGVENPDYESFFNLDEVVEHDGKKIRGVKNRVNALLDLLNENYMSNFDDADESLGGLEGARLRVDRLRMALADGTLNNEDFAAAASLGLNLRTLLSTDGNITFGNNGEITSRGNNPEDSESSLQTTDLKLQELVYGKLESKEQVLNRIQGWNSEYVSNFNLGSDENFSADNYMNSRIDKLHENNLDSYYRNEFFPKFFQNLKKYTPEYMNQHANDSIKTWEGDIFLKDYVRKNLTLAIRNKLYGENHFLISDTVFKNLNKIVDSDYWTVPESFDESTGTLSLFNPKTGDYKRVSINNKNLKIEVPVANGQTRTFTLLEDYLINKKIIQFSKNGSKLLLGGSINDLIFKNVSDEEKTNSYNQRFSKNNQTLLVQDPTQLKTKENSRTEGTHAEDVITGENGKDWETEDYARLVSLGSDLVSLVGGYVGLGAGIASTASDVVGDIADESLTGWDVAKNAGINAAWTIAGIVPGVKLGKIGKVLLKWGPRGLALLDSYGLISDKKTYDALNRMFTTGEITSDDLNILTRLGRAITGGVGMAKATKREHIYKKGQGEYQGKEVVLKQEGNDTDLKHTFTKDELSKINKAGQEKGQKAANEEVLRILREKNVLDEATSSKTTLKENIFGDGDSRYAKFKRRKKEVKGTDKYTGRPEGHTEFLNEKYGKWMGIENKGEGLITRTPSLGIKNKYNRVKNLVLGDSEYDNYVNNKRNTAETSENPKSERVSEETPKTTNSEAPPKTSTKNEAPVVETPAVETPAETSRVIETPENNVINNAKNGPEITPEKQDTSKPDVKIEEKENLRELQELKIETSDKAIKATKIVTASIPSTKKDIQKAIQNKNYDEKTIKKLQDYLEEIEKYNKNRKKGSSPRRVNRNKVKLILAGAQTKLPGFNKGSKLEQIIKFKKLGGILKAQNGNVLTFEDFLNLYKLHELGNINLKDRKQFADVKKLNDHNKDFTLRTAHAKNDYYTNSRHIVNSDLQNYYNVGKFASVDDFINAYNADAQKIRSFWDKIDHKANTEKGLSIKEHNLLFKKLFPSRSQSNNENAAYNIGYDESIDNIMGTSTWMRRMDRYKGAFDINNPNKSRIHKIDLGNGKYGYIYKTENGDIKKLDNNIGDKVLSDNYLETGTVPYTLQDTTPGNDFDWINGKIYGGDSAIGSASRSPYKDYYQYIAPTLAMGRMFGDIEATNRRTKNYLSRLLLPLQSPWQFYRQVYGDYGSLKAAENYAANIRNRMSRPFTSNANLATLRELEGERLAAEQLWKGHTADNEMIHKTSELAAAEQKENIKRATDVANINRGLMAEDAKYRAGVLAAADLANHNSFDTWLMNYVEKPILEEANKRKAYQEYYDYLSLGPMEYDFSNDPKLIDAQRKLAAISDTDPQRAEKRAQILNEINNYRITTSNNYKLAQLRKFRQLYPYIHLNLPLELYSSYNTTGTKIPSSGLYIVKKGGVLKSGYPAAVIRAKSKDNDRLIKQILEVIKNHKDLAKGVKITDYSKYIIKDLK